jgi:hypothetical protein
VELGWVLGDDHEDDAMEPFENLLKEPTLIGALVLSLVIIALLLRFLFYIYKKFEEHKLTTHDEIMELSKSYTDVLQEHNKNVLAIISETNKTLQQMNLSIAASTEATLKVEASTDRNTEASREMKDFLTQTLITVLRDKT